MKAHQASYSVATMCRMLEVSTSGFYAWLKRPASARSRSDAEMTEMIKQIHTWSRGTYGVPRMRDELMARDKCVNHKRISRLMRAAGLAGVSRRKGTYTTRRERDAAIAPDLVSRDFTAHGPDQLWVSDITYVPTWAGFLYLAVVMDAWSRRIVGWAMATHLRTELVLDASNSLLSLTGLSHLTLVGGDLLIGPPEENVLSTTNRSLKSLKGMERLSQVRGKLQIRRNPALESLTGLEGWTS